MAQHAERNGRRAGMVKRGEVWLVKLDPTVGSEIQKTRPCLIVSPEDLNRSLRTLMIVPLTTGSQSTRFRLPCRFRGKDGLILPDQIRTVSRERLVSHLGKVSAGTLGEVLRVLQEMFGE